MPRSLKRGRLLPWVARSPPQTMRPSIPAIAFRTNDTVNWPHASAFRRQSRCLHGAAVGPLLRVLSQCLGARCITPAHLKRLPLMHYKSPARVPRP